MRAAQWLGWRFAGIGLILAFPAAVMGQPDFSYSRPKGARQPMAAMPKEAPDLPVVKFGNFKPFNAIDNFILARLKDEKRTPKAVCSDFDFLRRSALDICGIVPNADDVANFMTWPAKDRRAKWVDHLLKQEQYADHWTSYWGDLLRERSNQRGIPRDSFRQYIHDQLKRNRPYDEWVREMISAEGESESVPAVAYVLGEEVDPNALTVATSQVFLGVQLKCAQCHNHPFDWWTQEDFKGMAAFFGGTRRKVYRVDEDMRMGKKLRQPFFEVVENPRRGRGKYLTGETSGEGRGRKALAELITRQDNPYFAREAVNRLWATMMGTGLVNPVDALGPRNPPTHPELLDWMACEFVSSGYNIKHMLRLIATSRTYQESSEERVAVAVHKSKDKEADADEHPAGSLYDAMPLRRMTAEEFYDSMLAATGHYDTDDRRYKPSIEVRTPAPENNILRVFGQSDRLTIIPRDPAVTVQQSLSLLNGNLVNTAIRMHRDHPIKQWRARGMKVPQIIEALFVQFLTRPPTPNEAQAAQALIGLGYDDRAWEDLQWALLNTREFQFIR